MSNDTLRFHRATRDDCTRSADPLQGPYADASRDWFDSPVMWVIGLLVLGGTVWYSATHPWGWW
jgi:hypothetical protein